MAYAFSRAETPRLPSDDHASGVKVRRLLLAVWSAGFHWRPTAELLREKPSRLRKLPPAITISRIILKNAPRCASLKCALRLRTQSEVRQPSNAGGPFWGVGS